MEGGRWNRRLGRRQRKEELEISAFAPRLRRTSALAVRSGVISDDAPSRAHAFLTFGADLADLLHVVLGAIVDGMRDSTLADSLVLAGRRRAEHRHVRHRLAQLSGGDADAA